MPTRDENIVERPIVPYNPAQANVRNRDVYNLYAPVAGPNKVGMAGYNPKDFRVDDQVVSLSDAIKSGYIYRVDVGPNTTLPEGVRYTVDGIKTPNNLYYNYTNQVIKSDSLTEKETVTGALFVFHSLINDISYIQTEVFSANGETWTRALNITNDEVTNIGDFIVTSKYYSNLSKQYAEASAESAEQSANSAQAAAQSAQAAADSAQAAAQSAQAAADNVKAAQDNVVAAQEAAAASAQHAGTSAQYATQSAQSATESAQYAQDSADSAELARKYAELGIQPNTDYNSYSELPRPGSTKFIYLIPAEDGTENDNYNEYIWVPAKNDYEYIGSTRIDLSNYAQKDGTYSGMTVGKATQADNAATATDSEKLGGVLADEYTLKTGTYPDMTVGNATNAENAEHATSADSATDAQAAAQADKLAAARTMQVNLASSNAAEFDGTENVTPGVTGILPVENGGTGANSLANITVGNATKATQDGDGNNIAETYAKQSGTYPNMTVGNATNADAATAATNATNDDEDNNIFDTYMGHWALNKTKDGTKQKDFNNYTEAGFYELFAGSEDSWSNFPISNDNPSSINGNWFLLVLKRSDDYITQIAVSVRGDTAIAIRNCSGGTWGSWRIISQYIGGARKTLGLENVSSGTFTFYNQKTYTIRKDSNVSDWWFRIGMSGNIVTVGIQFNPSKQLTKGTRYRLAYGLPTNQQNESGFWAMMDDVGDAQGDFEIDMNGNLYFTSHNYNITTSTYLNGGAMYITGDVV